jgi:membrane dipeptidase
VRSIPRALVLALLLPLACATTDDGGSALHFEAIVVDTHSDTTPRFEDPAWDFGVRHDDGHMDLPRIREGGLDVEFWSIYLGEREAPGAAITEALERIDAVYGMLARHADQVVLARSVADIRRGVAEGKLVSLMGIEGGHIIEGSLPALRSFYRLGVRYMTLTHSFHTDWADSSGTREQPEPRHGGLTDFGREVVREMNRLGMMVDVSHVSDATFHDVVEASSAPIIASHSSVRALAEHTRNMSDDMLRALAGNGGVIMINFYPGYIDEAARDAGRAYFREHGAEFERIQEAHAHDPNRRRELGSALLAKYPFPQCDLAVLLDHFDHAISVAGPDHVGIGADWDGVPSMPVGMEDVSRLPALTKGLLDRGHSPSVVRKVLGENLLRVLREVEIEAERRRSLAVETAASQSPS